MIKKFDKHVAVSLYKREFAEMIEECMYEEALDYLIKFRDETGMPDFHLACGMVYLLISQTSDDREFYSLALRELLLHVREFPDCRVAYRNILAAEFFRHDPEAMIMCGEWIRHRGFDIDEMLEELASVDIDMFLESTGGIFMDDLFESDGFGSISVDVPKSELASFIDSVENEQKPKGSRIIKFKGGAESSPSTPCGDGKVLPIKGGESDDAQMEATLELIKNIAKEYDAEVTVDEKNETFTIVKEKKSVGEDGDAQTDSRMLLRDAERFCERGDYRKALDKLDRISKTDMHLYYCAQCLKGYIYIEIGDIDSAKSSVDVALDIRSDGALAGTLLCGIYEIQGKFDMIPGVLMSTDIGDYIDADHAYKAFTMAVKYCPTEDALDLAEDFIDEYNVLDMRLIYAQMLYNSGEREDALRELYMLTRLQPTDFNVKYYYMLAKSDVSELPVSIDAPYKALGTIIDNFITYMLNDTPSDDMIKSEAFQTGLNIFLTLEYDYDRRIMSEMFDTLFKLACDVRLEGEMRDALISPYVEPLIKATILSKLMERDKKFLMEVEFCPMSDDTQVTLEDGYSQGFYTAYAFVTVFGKHTLKRFSEFATEMKSALDGIDAGENDKALYLLRAFKKLGKDLGYKYDDRIDYALGYATKTEATRAYKKINALVGNDAPQGEHL